MIRHLITLVTAFLLASCGADVTQTAAVQSEKNTQPMQTQNIRFTANDLSLSALLDTPTNGEAKALVVFVHGYGPTNVVEQNWYYDLRSRFAKQGVSSFVWDKPGQGESEGVFDANQSVHSSAAEIVAATKFLRDNKISGSQKIGLWGISRAGWIAPLAMAQDKEIDFWISVSGVDEKESFGYLLQSNWRLKGYPEKRIKRLYNQWLEGNQIVAQGRSYKAYIDATKDLREDPFMRYISNSSSTVSEDEFNNWVADVKTLNQPIDPKSGLTIYVEGFEKILSSLDINMLAIFGEKDSSVDWKSTQSLYQKTIGQNLNADLSIITFPNGNHNLHQSKTGAFEEMIEILNNPKMVEGYFDSIAKWLDDNILDH